MVEPLLVAGLAVAVFVGVNIGGSSTGVAFGPAVGSGALSKTAAAVLMLGFALLGGWTVGRNVVETMGGQIVPAATFTLAASVAILFFVGLALLVSNLFGVPASTSMTAVGAIAGLGLATGTIDWGVMGRIVSWWLVAPILAFWVCAVVGRYLYPHLSVRVPVDREVGFPFVLERRGGLPRLGYAPGAGPAEAVLAVLVIVIACYMAFSAGASNVANAVAPLVGNGAVSMDVGILLAAGAIGVGGFTIARRTLETVGNDLTDLPLLAALVVEIVAASLITFLSWIGIPASLAVSATMAIIGLGWGRASRTTRLAEAAAAVVHPEPLEEPADTGPASLPVDEPEQVAPIGEEAPGDLEQVALYDPAQTGRVITLWIATPTISAALSYALFELVLGL